MKSSESMAPNSPKSAPDAPTDMDFWRWRADNKLPPKPEITYKRPILTANPSSSNQWNIDKVKAQWYLHLHPKFLQNPNSCSSLTPMNSRLNMLAIKWMAPAWSQMHDTRRHSSPSCTTSFFSRAPSFSSLQKLRWHVVTHI